MLFKKRTEVEVELTEEEIDNLEKIEMLRRRFEALHSDHLLNKVSDAQYQREEEIINKEIDDLQRNINGFDDMMGHPIEYLDEIFNYKSTEKTDEGGLD